MWINGFEDRYEITKNGKVFFHKNGNKNERKLVPDKNGYMTVNIKKEGKTFCKKIHREVAKAYVYPFDGEQVNHKDGDKKNNNVENLEWVTNAENNKHMWELGLKQLGKKYSNSQDFLGVKPSGKKFIARLTFKKQQIYLGTYDSQEEAFEAIKIEYKKYGVIL